MDDKNKSWYVTFDHFETVYYQKDHERFSRDQDNLTGVATLRHYWKGGHFGTCMVVITPTLSECHVSNPIPYRRADGITDDELYDILCTLLEENSLYYVHRSRE